MQFDILRNRRAELPETRPQGVPSIHIRQAGPESPPPTEAEFGNGGQCPHPDRGQRKGAFSLPT